MTATASAVPGASRVRTVAELVERLGGTCTWGELRRAVHWRRIAHALDEGSVVRRGRGLYGLPGEEDARLLARRLTAVVSHRSAALHWGWKVKTTPNVPDVTVPRNRKVRKGVRDLANVRSRTLAKSEIEQGWVTNHVRTVIDCCLDLPLDEALAVFDSALRSGVPKRDVVKAAAGLGTIQRSRVLRVARCASPRAANPFESVLRAVAIGIQGSAFEPQHRIRYDDFYAKVDLADDELQIVLEAESFEFHGDKAALKRDCVRYTELAARGWLVLRFTWDQVMFQQDWVGRMIAMTVRRRRAELALNVGRGRRTGRTGLVAVR